jgi:hypothetical protein
MSEKASHKVCIIAETAFGEVHYLESNKAVLAQKIEDLENASLRVIKRKLNRRVSMSMLTKSPKSLVVAHLWGVLGTPETKISGQLGSPRRKPNAARATRSVPWWEQ